MPLCPQLAADPLPSIDEFIGKVLADFWRERDHEFLCDRHVVVGSNTHTKPELCVVFEQGVRPGGSASFLVFRPRRCWQVAAID